MAAINRVGGVSFCPYVRCQSIRVCSPIENAAGRDAEGTPCFSSLIPVKQHGPVEPVARNQRTKRSMSKYWRGQAKNTPSLHGQLPRL